jgi:DNA helicase-2/ATP-dependent DNA helicase PcrA
MDVLKEVVAKTSGPCVVLAGAGTGKTFTIVEKIKSLLLNKIYKPQKIVCITFSNEAANSLQSRVMKEVGENNVVIKTFHSFCADLLRDHGSLVGVNKDFKILDSNEAKVFLHRFLAVKPYYCHKYVSSISQAKDLGISIEEIEEHHKKISEMFKDVDIEKRLDDLKFELQTIYLKEEPKKKKQIVDEIEALSEITDLKKFIQVYRAYEKLKEKKNYLDYSDLNLIALRLLKEKPEVATNYDYVIVDEFQDTNKVQLDFLFYLGIKNNIMIVGDMNQSIYGFRGAYKDNFSQFKKHFNVSESEIFALKRSHRSPNSVLRVAHKLILNNYANKEDCFLTENAYSIEGNEVEVYKMKNGKEEARKVVELIEQELANGRDYGDICVMFRTHQQGVIIRRLLDVRGIKYISVTKESLLKHSKIRNVINYLRIIESIKSAKKGGEGAWWDLIFSSGFSEQDLAIIGKFIKDNKEVDNFNQKMIENLLSLGLSESGQMGAKIILDKVNLLKDLDMDNSIELINKVYEILGLLTLVESNDDKDLLVNLNKFRELVGNHAALYSPDLSSFLYYLDVINNLNIDVGVSEVDRSGVNLMTLHATKGLEYPVVIVTNLAQKRFPIERAFSKSSIPDEVISKHQSLKDELENQLSEERRLCYVAFTRSKEKLILTFADKYSDKEHTPSQFLIELEPSCNKDVKMINDDEEKYENISSQPEIKSGLEIENKKDLSNLHFSPSALLLFTECAKKYEYRYVYNMPEPKTLSWDEMRLGSFVHLILEEGVENKLEKYEDYVQLANERHLEEDWNSVKLEDALQLIKVFYERNKKKYNQNSRTEQRLKMNIDGLNFVGYADRIDISDKGLEIIDYKTGFGAVPPKHRNWQLGYYALAAQQNLGKVHKITLDMLRHDKPLEFELDENGNAKAVHARMEFNIYDVEEEMLKAAKEIIESYKYGFKSCSLDSNCEFCNEYVYGKK